MGVLAVQFPGVGSPARPQGFGGQDALGGGPGGVSGGRPPRARAVPLHPAPSICSPGRRWERGVPALTHPRSFQLGLETTEKAASDGQTRAGAPASREAISILRMDAGLSRPPHPVARVPSLDEGHTGAGPSLTCPGGGWGAEGAGGTAGLLLSSAQTAPWTSSLCWTPLRAWPCGSSPTGPWWTRSSPSRSASSTT